MKSDATAQGLAFQVGHDELGLLFRDRLGLSWNGLSPFADRLASYAAGSAAASPQAAALAAHPQFAAAAAVLARPDVRITVRHAGPAVGAFTACCSRGQDAVIVVFPSDGGQIIRLFDSSEDYFGWWLNPLTSGPDDADVEDRRFSMPLGTLLYWLHAVDAYRLARKQPMDSAAQALSIPVSQFVDAMAESVATRDLHRLLPAFLALTPGLDTLKLQPDAADLKRLADLGLLIPAKDFQTDERVFRFGNALANFGDEFASGVDTAAGLDIALGTERGAVRVFHGFLAPTQVANHFFEIQPGADGTGLATHEALSRRRLYATLVGLLSAALHPNAPATVLKRLAVPNARPGEASQVVCSHCGQANPASMKFCGHCGKAMSPARAPDTSRAVRAGAPGGGGAPPLPTAFPPVEEAARVARPDVCSDCGKPLRAGVKFCTHCGARVIDGAGR